MTMASVEAEWSWIRFTSVFRNAGRYSQFPSSGEKNLKSAPPWWREERGAGGLMMSWWRRRADDSKLDKRGPSVTESSSQTNLSAISSPLLCFPESPTATTTIKRKANKQKLLFELKGRRLTGRRRWLPTLRKKNLLFPRCLSWATLTVHSTNSTWKVHFHLCSRWKTLRNPFWPNWAEKFKYFLPFAAASSAHSALFRFPPAYSQSANRKLNMSHCQPVNKWKLNRGCFRLMFAMYISNQLPYWNDLRVQRFNEWNDLTSKHF